MPLNHTSIYSELTDEHFTTIGKIVVEWSNIESLICVLLSRLLVTPEFLARSYTDHMSAAKLQDAIQEGVGIHRERYNGELISMLKLNQIIDINERITALRATRNKFAHFCWIRESDETILGTSFSGGSPGSKKHNKSFIAFTTSELSNFYKNAYELVEELSSLIETLPEMTEDGLKSKITYPQSQLIK